MPRYPQLSGDMETLSPKVIRIQFSGVVMATIHTIQSEKEIANLRYPAIYSTEGFTQNAWPHLDTLQVIQFS